MAQPVSVRRSWLEKTVAGLDRIARRRGKFPEVPPHLALGLAGEDAAFFHLRSKGFRVVARRWSSGDVPGDIDLIAWHGALLCFIEVKTRSEHDLTPAESAVDAHKRRVLRRLARRYVRQCPLELPPQVRFDVISVYLMPGMPAEVVHFENQFGWTELRVE